MIIELIVEKEKILLDTGDYYFSPRKIDKGTEVLLSEICFESDDKVLYLVASLS